jgi:hypothetical protein
MSERRIGTALAPRKAGFAEVRRFLPLPTEARMKETGAGSRGVYSLVRAANGLTETPIFLAHPHTTDEAAAIFLTRESAVRYLQVAQWDYRIQRHSPRDLLALVEYYQEAGIQFILVDPNRHNQARGILQPSLELGYI